MAESFLRIEIRRRGDPEEGREDGGDPLLCLLHDRPCSLDELALQASLPVAEVARRVLELELGGRIRRRADGRLHLLNP